MKKLRSSKGPLSIFLVAALSLGVVACGDDSDDGDGAGASGSGAAGSGGSGSGATGSGATGSGATGSGATGSGASGGQPADIPDFNGCTSGEYVDLSGPSADRTITIAPGGALEYGPKCAIIGAGQTVTFTGNLSFHPTAPGNPDDLAAGEYAGTSPIVETTSGTTVDFAFADAGTYPYHCKVHSFGAGEGMAGVIHVK
jgi:plastocyanin